VSWVVVHCMALRVGSIFGILLEVIIFWILALVSYFR
jgi:hypothetical protein